MQLLKINKNYVQRLEKYSLFYKHISCIKFLNTVYLNLFTILTEDGSLHKVILCLELSYIEDHLLVNSGYASGHLGYTVNG